jgi:hypothetical protein
MTRSLLQRVPRYLPRPALRGLSSEAKPTNELLNRATQPLPAGSTHRPSEFYARARTDRDLPDTRSRTPVVFGLTALGLGVWVAFYSYATNSERLSNSVTLQVIDTARADPVLRELLGDAIRPAPTWWLNGDPWISGTVSLTCITQIEADHSKPDQHPSRPH